MDKNEAINKLKAFGLLLNDYFQVENIYLFGSYAKNTNREDSDIDVQLL